MAGAGATYLTIGQLRPEQKSINIKKAIVLEKGEPQPPKSVVTLIVADETGQSSTKSLFLLSLSAQAQLTSPCSMNRSRANSTLATS